MTVDQLAIPLAGAVASWSLVALITHCLATLLSRASRLKRYTAKQLVVASAINLTGVLTAVGRAATRVVLWLFLWWVAILVMFLFFSTIYVTYTELPGTWTGAVRAYNLFLGPYVYSVILIPLRLADLFLRALIPVWNGFFWFLKALAVQGLLPVLLEQIGVLVDMATSLYMLLLHLTFETARFVQSFACTGKACLQPERGVQDLLTSMADVRELAIHTTRLTRAFCGTLAAPVDLLMYPLMDPSFAAAVHNLVNAVIQLFVIVPWFTTIRCGEKANNQFAILMCTPDLAPTFNFLAASVGSLGLAIDNWLNVGLLIIETALGGTPPVCASSVDTSMIPDLLAADPIFPASSRTVLVGLTDWLYAVTDGTTAVYTGHGAQARMARWPYRVDPSLGVAAVTYSQVHELDVSTFSSGKTAHAMQTTAMLGCDCQDTAEGLAVSCAILPSSGVPSESSYENYRLRVLFSDPRAAALYTCAGVDLYVKSVRWSYTRYETITATLGTSGDQSGIPVNDCISRGTCRELDATVWLIPRCGQDVPLNAETACIATAPCMPFCMAARASGSGPANLVLARANSWRSGNTILGQDCAMDGAVPETIQLGTPSGPGVSSSRSKSYIQSLLQTGTTEIYSFASRTVCSRAAGITSVVQKDQTRVAYNVQLNGQPFAMTGDTVLTTINLGGGADSVQVRENVFFGKARSLH